MAISLPNFQAFQLYSFPAFQLISSSAYQPSAFIAFGNKLSPIFS
jgi:hypothetical protein